MCAFSDASSKKQMTPTELLDLVDSVRKNKAESNFLELKKAHLGSPKRLYDTLSSFSNQDGGGVILFGLDEDNDFEAVGVYDPQDLQRQIKNQCRQMQPPVRAVLTVAEREGKHFVAAEIPGLDYAQRPCFYAGAGRMKGAFVRVGDSDEPMSEYEIYSFEAFRQKYQDDIAIVQTAERSDLDSEAIERYIARLKAGKPNLSRLPDEQIYRLMNLLKGGHPTVAAMLLFGLYPQAFFPQLSIIATVVPGVSVGETGADGERFSDNERIDGTIEEMLERTIRFVARNIRVKTIINPETGKREDKSQYSMVAVREAILNALVHRDYSMHTQGQPIEVKIFQNRLEIANPGGLYGRMTLDQLGRVQPDTRNPVLVNALEVLGLTENRYSGIPVMCKEAERLGMEKPIFEDQRGSFRVTFLGQTLNQQSVALPGGRSEDDILSFCAQPRSREELKVFLGVNTTSYMMRKFVMPLIVKGRLALTLPNAPKSSKQRFVTVA